ncbi:MAG: ketopantoate reductase family protein [Candidatus Thorarchaeota archaeon]
MKKSIIRIGFIGAGSIGSLFGGYLASIKSDIYSIEVILFCRKNHADAINENGLVLYNGDAILEIKNIKAFENLDEFKKFFSKESKDPFDFIFISTKTYDIETALFQYNKLVDKCKRVVILQNGIGNEEIVSKYCHENKIIRIVTSNGALIEKPGHVIHTGKGFTKIGFPFYNALDVQDDEIAKLELRLLTDLLNYAGLEAIMVDDIIKECWEKIFVNIGINAFGALTRLKNGKLLENKGLKYLMGEAVKEAVKVAKMKNINLPKKDFIALTYDVAEKTSENKNSMLQDVLKGKKTEVDFINGRILKYAKELGINTPINKLLTYLVKGLEQS